VLTDIRAPMFCVGTAADHVAPWRSVYKIHLLTETELTFVLTAGGHNAGIVSEPGRAGRSYQVMVRTTTDRYQDPDHWLTVAPYKDGSWWTELADWLVARSAAPVAKPSMGSDPQAAPQLRNAPGLYVLQS
jgi:polyhydroxyalkanoate synthase